jgi:hypothetical protein
MKKKRETELDRHINGREAEISKKEFPSAFQLAALALPIVQARGGYDPEEEGTVWNQAYSQALHIWREAAVFLCFEKEWPKEIPIREILKAYVTSISPTYARVNWTGDPDMGKYVEPISNNECVFEGQGELKVLKDYAKYRSRKAAHSKSERPPTSKKTESKKKTK